MKVLFVFSKVFNSADFFEFFVKGYLDELKKVCDVKSICFNSCLRNSDYITPIAMRITVTASERFTVPSPLTSAKGRYCSGM